MLRKSSRAFLIISCFEIRFFDENFFISIIFNGFYYFRALMDEIELRQSTGREKLGETLPSILNQLFENYTVDEMNEILLNTLYRAMANPNQDITR